MPNCADTDFPGMVAPNLELARNSISEQSMIDCIVHDMRPGWFMNTLRGADGGVPLH